MSVQEKGHAGEGPEELHCLAEGQSGQDGIGTARPGQHQPHRGLLFPDRTDTMLQIRAVSRQSRPPCRTSWRATSTSIVADPVATLQQVRGGNVQAYAVCADKRLPSAPDIPTVDEAGLPGYHVALWHGLWLPKGMPKPIMDRLHAAAVEALADPAVRWKLESLGQDIYPRERQTPQALASPAEGRDRKVVADHQGRQHQGGINRTRPWRPLRPRTALTGCGQRAQPWRGVRNLGA